MGMVTMGMMDVLVGSSPIDRAEVTVDLGGCAGKLILSVGYDTDHYRDVRVTWKQPAIVTGRPVKDLKRTRILDTTLDVRARRTRKRRTLDERVGRSA